MEVKNISVKSGYEPSLCCGIGGNDGKGAPTKTKVAINEMQQFVGKAMTCLILEKRKRIYGLDTA